MKSCKYCGNNPVPHFIYWYNETANILFTPIRNFLLYNFITKSIVKKKWGVKLVLEFLFLAGGLKIISRQTDINKCKVRRAQVLWEEAEKRGLKMQELLLFGRPFDCYVVEQGLGFRVEGVDKTIDHKLKIKNFLVFSGLPRPAGYYNPRLDLMDDKAWFKQFMRKNNFPVPIGKAVTNFRQAREIFSKIKNSKLEIRNLDHGQKKLISEFPNFQVSNFAIVKPRSGSRGRHGTTFILSESDLKYAFKIAKQLCYWVVVEEQLFGPVYRATVINFKLAGVLRGDSPQVVGDGLHSVNELVKIKNATLHLGIKDISLDERVEGFVRRQILKDIKDIKDISISALDYTPKLGEVIYLSEKIGVNYGGSSSEDLEICHPDNIELFEKAAKVLGDPILGFDFIIPDITKSYKNQKCGFIEVNTLPFINLHHDPFIGKPQNVAGKIWDMIGV